MCVRLACGLEPEEILNCCCYKPSEGNNFVIPQWKSFRNGGKTYKRCYNICKTDIAPVLLHDFGSNLRTVVTMVFGVIPHWPKQGKQYETVNCRMESMKESKLYSPLLKKGQRCVVVCSGFYEWQTIKKTKKPYFIHAEQPSGVVVADPMSWNLGFTPENGCSGFKPLRMAALYAVNNEKELYSFAIITKEASSNISWLHDRMPLLVETEEQLEAWLNSKQFSPDEALKVFAQTETNKITWCPVSTIINNVKNKDIDIQQIMESVKKEPKTLLNYFGKRENEGNGEVPLKIKKENDENDEGDKE